MAMVEQSQGLMRRPSMATSSMGAVNNQRRGLQADFDFSLSAAKAKVLKAMDEAMPAAFARFYQSSMYDRILTGCMLYFCALLQKDALARCMERARQQHLDGYNPYLVAARLKELETEAAAARAGLSAPYAEALLAHSSYKKPQQDKHFFECLYASLFSVLEEAVGWLGRMPVVAKELGALFRGKHFNSAARTYGPTRSVDTLTVTQIWSLKNESGNRSLHAKLISSLAEKPAHLAVQIAALSNTPLITQAVSSPVVARSLLKDPQERDKMFGPKRSGRRSTTPTRRRAAAADSRDEGAESRWKTMGAAAVGKSGLLKVSVNDAAKLQPSQTTLTAAGIVPTKAAERQYKRLTIAPDAVPGTEPSTPHGVGVSAAGLSPITPRSTFAAQSAAAVSMTAGGPGTAQYGQTGASMSVPATPGPLTNTSSASAARASTMKPFQGVLASLPEAVGLPYDEAYAYLCLLRRYILYGPTLGLAGRGPGAGGAGHGGYSTAGGASLSRHG